MGPTTFSVDEKMDKQLEELREHLGVSSKSEVIRQALALLKIAKQAAQPDGSLIIKNGDEELTVKLK
jgi:Arc/MetJ-type ribon-helix-helix transcriptional regulator